MSRYLRLRILMPENRQQIDQGKTLRGSSCIRRFAIFIQSAFIADSDTMPVESTHMSTHLRDGTAMVKNSVTGNKNGNRYQESPVANDIREAVLH